ncbi:hypothetical protein ACOME3_005971 [Neoechinorhynchus agilis]
MSSLDLINRMGQSIRKNLSFSLFRSLDPLRNCSFCTRITFRVTDFVVFPKQRILISSIFPFVNIGRFRKFFAKCKLDRSKALSPEFRNGFHPFRCLYRCGKTRMQVVFV